jgi:hypothetical protein
MDMCIFNGLTIWEGEQCGPEAMGLPVSCQIFDEKPQLSPRLDGCPKRLLWPLKGVMQRLKRPATSGADDLVSRAETMVRGGIFGEVGKWALRHGASTDRGFGELFLLHLFNEGSSIDIEELCRLCLHPVGLV